MMSNSAASNIINSTYSSPSATTAANFVSTMMLQEDSIKTTENTNTNTNDNTFDSSNQTYNIPSSRPTTDTTPSTSSTDTSKETNMNFNIYPSNEKEPYYCGIEVAFALNNMAIEMMEQGCIAQSCETFQSAVVAIRTIVSDIYPNTNDNNSYQNSLDNFRRVKAAIHHAMNPHTTPFPTSVNFRVVSSHWETSLFSSTASDSKPSSTKTCYTLIRLDNDDQQNDRCLHHSVPVATAVLLNNFAVASHVYFSYDSFDEAHRFKRLVECAGLLFHAFQNLENEECAAAAARTDDDLSSSSHNYHYTSFISSSFFYSRILFLLGTALQTLHSCLLALGQRDQAFACVERLVQIRTMVCVWNESMQMNHMKKAHAAAA